MAPEIQALLQVLTAVTSEHMGLLYGVIQFAESQSTVPISAVHQTNIPVKDPVVDKKLPTLCNKYKVFRTLFGNHF